MNRFLLVICFVLGLAQAQAKEAYAIYNNGTLTLYYDDARSTRGGKAYDVPNGTCYLPEIPYSFLVIHTGTLGHPWHENSKSTKKIVFDASFASYRPTVTYAWFTSFAVTEIQGMKYLNTSQVTDMQYMFAGCEYLTSLDLSHFTITESAKAGSLCFSCLALETLTLGNGIAAIGDNAFCNCIFLNNLTLPNSLKKISSGAFYNCYFLRNIVSQIAKPFDIRTDIFDEDTKQNATLTVPNGTKALYEACAGWKQFKHIVQAAPNRIDAVQADKPADAALYNLRGQRVTNPRKGLYIINGRKVLVPSF